MDKKKLNLLILEDNHQYTDQIIKEIEKNEFIVKEIFVCNEIEFKKALSKPVDLIFIDSELHSFKAIEAITLCKKLIPEIPIIIISNKLEIQSIVKYIKSGVSDYVLKDKITNLDITVKNVLNEAEKNLQQKQYEKFSKDYNFFNEQKLYNIFKDIYMPIFIFEKKTHRFIDCNNAVLRKYGYSFEELKKMTPYDLHPKEDLIRLKQNIDVRNINYPITYTHLTKNGERIKVAIFSFDINYQGHPCWVSIVEDITKRRQAEDALRKREEQLISILNNVTIHIWSFDGKYFPYISKEWYRYTGQDPTLRRTFERWIKNIHPDDMERVVEKWNKAWKDKNIFDDNFQLRNSKGKYRLFNSYAIPIYDKKGNFIHYQGYNIDITERMKAEESIRESEMMYRSLYETLITISKETDFNTLIKKISDQATIILKANDCAVYLLNDKGTLIPIYSNDIKDREAIMSYQIPLGVGVSGKAAETGKCAYLNWKTENDFAVHIPGTDIEKDEEESVISAPLFDGSDVVGAISVGKLKENFTEFDIKKLTIFARQAEIALKKAQNLQKVQRSEEQFRSLQRNVPVGIFRLNSKGQFISANPTLIKIMGCDSKEEVLKHKFKDIFINLNNYKEFINKLKFDKLLSDYEVKLQFKNNRFFYGLLSVNAITNKKGTIIHYDGILNDITARIKAEEQIRRNLKEKEVMLQEMHHRVKNNMQIISSILKIQSRYIKDIKSLELFNKSINRIKSMALIHEGLYNTQDLARIDFGKYAKSLIIHLFSSYKINTNFIDLNINIKNILLQINKAIPCGLIINELISNSLKYAFPEEAKGEISITMYAKKNLKNPATKNYILIISDNGTSIPENIDFKNADSLGMQLLNTLVEQLHGNIELNRQAGTSFKIIFPEFRNNINKSIN